ncbi:MAG: LTA synthase family protein [Roseburia sp.]
MSSKKNIDDEKGKISKKQIKNGAVAIFLFFIFPVFCFYLLELYTHNPFDEVRLWAQLFNILLFVLVQGILFCFSGSLKIAVRVELAVTMIYGIANAYVVSFRTNPIVPWDILSIKTAASVADNYNFMPSGRMVAVTVCFVILLFLTRWVQVKINRIAFWKRMIPGVTLVVALCVFANTLQEESFQNAHRLYNKLFTPVFMTEVDGIAVTFVMNLAYMAIEKPDGYSAQEAEELLSAYEAETDEQEEASVTEDELPNIIVVMNESFSDLSVLGDFTTNRDYMPYLHSLQEGAENTITGMLNVSVCGGNTANTEFEFLTGNTMAFLPQGSIAYQQYINGELPSIVSYLDTLGYDTYATHPYYASGWDRDTVYPELGFSNMLFLDSYTRAHYIRKYVSDESCVDKIISIYEEKEEGTPCFVFNVTMQNHGGYTEENSNFTPGISVEGVDDFALNQYLSLMEQSDQALEELINYFSEVDEKTMIVFFGDHQPSDTVAYPVLSLNGKSTASLTEEETKLRYEVPYVIWTNYETETVTDADTSVNYLGVEMLERAGITLPAYQAYLAELQEKYPILSAVRVVDKEGNETSVKEEKNALEEYQKLQYYQLFDWEGKE